MVISGGVIDVHLKSFGSFKFLFLQNVYDGDADT